MKKLLVTGASGFLGYHLLRLASSEYEVYGLHYRHSLKANGVIPVRCNLTNYFELGDVLEDIAPDAVIHTAAISDANFCQQNKDLSNAVNVEATVNLSGVCADFQIPFLFTSSDLVFDGTQGMYKECDTKNPLNLYGEQKSLAEEQVLKIYPNATVVRLPLMFGKAESSVNNYLQKFIAELRNQNAVNLFFDEYRSVCGARSIATGLLQIVELQHRPDIIHLAGPQRISRYDFGLLAANAFGLDRSLLKRCSQRDVSTVAKRPADVSMDISLAQSLGYAPLSVSQELNLMATNNYMI